LVTASSIYGGPGSRQQDRFTPRIKSCVG
jgi:hypothetical protein